LELWSACEHHPAIAAGRWDVPASVHDRLRRNLLRPVQRRPGCLENLDAASRRQRRPCPMGRRRTAFNGQPAELAASQVLSGCANALILIRGTAAVTGPLLAQAGAAHF